MGAVVRDLVELRTTLRGLPDHVHEALVTHLQDEVAQPLADKARARFHAMGRMGAHAANTVQVTNTEFGAVVNAGQGGGLDGVLFTGVEFGGRVRRKTYAQRSRRGGGRAHVVRQRRTTMMFRPHLGQRGYAFWPSVREALDGIDDQVRQVVAQAVDEAL